MEEKQRMAFSQYRYGLFVHYAPEVTVDRNGKLICDVNELADAFDAEGFARDVSSMGAEYVIFTAWHYKAVPLYPSDVMAKYRPPKYACRRDLIGDLLTACEAYGIGVLLYTHPRDGHDFPIEEAEALGWKRNPEKPEDVHPDFTGYDFERWNDFVCELYVELVQRYGSRIQGLWLDEGSPEGDSWRVVDYPRLAAAIEAVCPGLRLMNNFYGDAYGLDGGMKEYSRWGAFRDCTGESWPVYDKSVAAVIGQDWVASVAADQPSLLYDARALYRYLVLQAAANRQGGGVAWAVGPYPAKHEEGIWERDIFETLSQMGEALSAREGSVLGTCPSDAFPTWSGESFGSISYGCAMVSADRKYEYIHVLKEPKGRTLRLGKPENGARFLSAELLDTTPVQMTWQGEEILLTIPGEWDSLDTVIRLEIIPGTYGELGYHMLDDTDVTLFYSGDWEWKYDSPVRGDYEGNYHVARAPQAACRTLFTGTRVRVVAPLGPQGGRLAIYLDGVYYGQAEGYAPEYRRQQTVFDSGILRKGCHRLELVALEPGAAIDALRIDT